MTIEHASDSTSRRTESEASILGWITVSVLLAVILSIAWIVVAAYEPEWVEFASTDLEVALVAALLLAALILVSVAALRQTRS